jgi:GcrA cell cycle regulator
VFLKEKWQNWPVPVENGSTKRGGRLPHFAGYSSVSSLGYKMSWVLRRARAVDLSSNSEFFAPSPDETGDSESNSRRPTMAWTEERVELLKKLWAEGLSASQIAARLGGVTRNAVIGKVHRLGLSGRAKSPASAAPRARKPRTHIMRVGRPAMRGNTALALAFEMAEEPEVELVENVIPIGQRRTLLELTEDTCRWPIGDPASADFFFCGGKPVTGVPYCHFHSRVAYQPAADRRRDRRPMRG